MSQQTECPSPTISRRLIRAKEHLGAFVCELIQFGLERIVPHTQVRRHWHGHIFPAMKASKTPDIVCTTFRNLITSNAGHCGTNPALVLSFGRNDCTQDCLLVDGRVETFDAIWALLVSVRINLSFQGLESLMMNGASTLATLALTIVRFHVTLAYLYWSMGWRRYELGDLGFRFLGRGNDPGSLVGKLEIRRHTLAGSELDPDTEEVSGSHLSIRGLTANGTHARRQNLGRGLLLHDSILQLLNDGKGPVRLFIS